MPQLSYQDRVQFANVVLGDTVNNTFYVDITVSFLASNNIYG